MSVEGSRSLCTQTHMRETRQVKHIGLSLQRRKMFTYLPPGMLGMVVIYNLVILCSLWGQASPESSRLLYLFTSDSPCCPDRPWALHLRSSLWKMPFVLYRNLGKIHVIIHRHIIKQLSLHLIFKVCFIYPLTILYVHTAYLNLFLFSFVSQTTPNMSPSIFIYFYIFL